MEQLTDVIILSPDQQTARYLTATIAPTNSCTAIVVNRGWEKRAADALKKKKLSKRPVLIVVPSNNLGPVPLALTRTCSEQQGLTLVWAQHSTHQDDVWLLLQLLQTEGAIVCESLDVLAQMAHIFYETNGISFFSIETAQSKSALMRHIADALVKAMPSEPVASTTKNVKNQSAKIKVDKNARIIFELRKKTYPINSSPSIIGEALSLLCAHYQKEIRTDKKTQVVPNAGIIEMIARPPARILSETTSKRLLSAFGLRTPSEKLCDSPSKAMRFSKELKGAATLKLVRPNFRFKSIAGAVIQHVRGPSEIQKSYQSLVTLSEKLGTPKALGILVSEQIECEHLFWIDAKRDDNFGRVIRFGKQNQVNESPDGALSLPCTLHQCSTALRHSYPSLPTTARRNLEDALFRFSQMIEMLSDHIGLAQIHPLAITENGALMLDAVIGITDEPLMK